MAMTETDLKIHNHIENIVDKLDVDAFLRIGKIGFARVVLKRWVEEND